MLREAGLGSYRLLSESSNRLVHEIGPTGSILARCIAAVRIVGFSAISSSKESHCPSVWSFSLRGFQCHTKLHGFRMGAVSTQFHIGI